MQQTEPWISAPARPVSTITPPSFAMPAHACDTHFHVFEDDARYKSIAKPRYTLPPAPLTNYLELADALGIERMVFVQASYYGTDNSCMLDAMAKVGARCRGVVMLEESESDAELDRMHALGVRAARLDLFLRSQWPTAEIEAYIARSIARVRSRGWHIQFYSPGHIVRDLLPYLAKLDIDFVIDHMGYMLEQENVAPGDFERLLDVLRQGRCWIKLTGPYRLAKHGRFEVVTPVARALIDAAPDRVIWGTDWPHIPETDRDTGVILNLLADWAPDSHTRTAILAVNPARLFGFPDPTAGC